MKTITDYLILGLSFYFILVGARDGFLKTIMGPIALVIATILSYIYYNRTENLIGSLLIGLIAPILIKIILNFVPKIWAKMTRKEITEITWQSRLLGAAIHLLWSGALVAIVLVLLSILPSQLPWMKNIQEDVVESYSYKFVYFVCREKLPSELADVKATIKFFEDPKRLEKLESVQEFQELMEDNKVQDILNDEKTKAQLQGKKLVALMQNPKIHAIIKDKEILEKIYKLNKKILQKDPAQDQID